MIKKVLVASYCMGVILSKKALDLVSEKKGFSFSNKGYLTGAQRFDEDIIEAAEELGNLAFDSINTVANIFGYDDDYVPVIFENGIGDETLKLLPCEETVLAFVEKNDANGLYQYLKNSGDLCLAKRKSQFFIGEEQWFHGEIDHEEDEDYGEEVEDKE